jgi:hypothetical protein
MTSTGLGDIHNINIATPTAMEETAAPIRIVRLFIQAVAAEANSKSSFRHNAAARPDLHQRSGNNDDGNDGKTHELLRNTTQQQTGKLSASTLSDDDHIGHFPGNRLKE